MELIEAISIFKTYNLGQVKVPVLKGVSLSVSQGEYLALMGASGSGQSTLMNILGCLDRPTAGQYFLDGEEVSQAPSDRPALFRSRKIGFVFQNFNLLPKTSALDNVILPLIYHPQHRGDKSARKRAIHLLEQLGLRERLHHEPSQLSGGQQQRVAIARALINQPAILLADEPTGNLDSHTSREILEMFGKLNAEQGIPLILVTYNPNVARQAQRIITIQDGIITGQVPEKEKFIT